MFWNKKVNIQQAKLKLIQEKLNNLLAVLLESGADIIVAPETDQYFIVDENRSISIGVSNSKIRVANHVYTYSETLPLEFLEKLKKQIRSHMESRALALKKELFKNEVELIDKITNLYK